jgi:hypothetical protein
MNDTQQFLKRINNKYNNVNMEDNIENFVELGHPENTMDNFVELGHPENTMDNIQQPEIMHSQRMMPERMMPQRMMPQRMMMPQYTRDNMENFANLEDDNNMPKMKNMNNNVNKLSSPENLSGFVNGDISCNMDKQQKELVDDYKNKYFRMYRHQIECPKECQLHRLNLKKCNLSENNDCQDIFTNDYNNPDVFTLSNLALDKNNRRECVTCTANDNRQTRDMMVPDSNVNEEDEVKINERRLNNRNKFADFNDYIDRNGVMETSVDKIAELRTSNTGTCGLNSYGKKVSDVYDNLLSTTYSEEKNQCVYGPVEGINDSNSNDTYASVL